MKYISFLMILLVLMGCNRYNTVNDGKSILDISIEYDIAYINQQLAIAGKVYDIKEQLEWKYKKGKQIVKYTAVTIIVVAIVAGIVVLSSGNGGSLGSIDLGSIGLGDPMRIFFSDDKCNNVYFTLKISECHGRFTFNAPIDSDVYIYTGWNSMKYSIGHIHTGSNGTISKYDIKLKCAEIISAQHGDAPEPKRLP